MTRSELIEKVASRLDGYTQKQAEIIVKTFFESIKDALSEGDKVEIRGFGNFRVRERKSRLARNPKTGESVSVPDKRTILFRCSKDLFELLNS